MKYLVETDQNITVDGIIRTLGIQGVFTKVTELPEIKQPQMVEYGILTSVIDVQCMDTDSYCCGDNVDLTKHPELKSLCKDIQTSIDWESIPVGSLVELQANLTYVGYYRETKHGRVLINGSKDDCVELRNSVLVDNIKYVRIIEEAK